MRTGPPNDLMDIIHDAASTLFGTLGLWLLAMTAAGFIPTALSGGDWNSFSLLWLFSWVMHLALSCMALAGLPFAVVHALCLHEMMDGRAHAGLPLSIAFLNQFTVSTGVTIAFEPGDWLWPSLAWTVVATLCALGWRARWRAAQVRSLHPGSGVETRVR